MDFSNKRFKSLANKSIDIIQKWYSENLRNKKIYHNKTPKEISKIFQISKNNKETKPEQVLNILKKNLINTSNFNPSPNYYGYITGGGNQIGMLAEFIKSALNQNNLKWHSAPANTEIEKIVIKWIAEFIGYNNKCGGVLVSGGSVANLLNIAVMRKIKGNKKINKKGIYNNKIMRVYVSSEAHSSIDKAMDILGLGSDNLIKIKTCKDFKIDLDSLEKNIKKDIKDNYQPIGVIGIAGTTNTGSIDPLKELGSIAKKFKLWYMIDAAYGGPASKVKKTKKLFKGIEDADSLLINPHKWLFVPFEVACVMVKNKKYLKQTFSLVPEYLRGGIEKNDREDLMNYSIQLSKDFKALKVWMTIKTYGTKNLKKAIENDIKMAEYAYELVYKSNDFIPIHKPELSIFCFQYLPKNNNVSADLINKKIIDLIEEDGRIFLSGTVIKKENVLRINCTNHRRKKSDVDYLFKILRIIGDKAESYF